MLHFLKRVIFIPCAVYTSVIIGGGYGTGREVVEFFSIHGAEGGLTALLTAFCVFVFVLFATFDLARAGAHFDYRVFFKDLIGPFWWVFELLYLALMFLVLGVVASAASQMLSDQYGLPPLIGTVATLLLIGLSLFAGRLNLERFMMVCLLAMYALFIAYFGSVMNAIEWGGNEGVAIVAESSASDAGLASASWSGALYAFYNLSVVPVLLFAVRDLHSRRESMVSAIAVSLTVLTPALLFHLSFTLAGTDVTSEAIPVYTMLDTHGAPALVSAFVIVLIITLAQTGAGLLQGLIERVEGARIWVQAQQTEMAPVRRVVFVVGVLSVSAILSSVGVVALIGKGYATLAMGFGLVYVLPLIVIGIPRILKAQAD